MPLRPLPFLYESTGVETWFTNGLDPDPTARRVFSFHRPEALGAWLHAELDRRAAKPGAPLAPTLKGRMRLAPPLNSASMWPAQVRAVTNLEASFCEGKPRALVQMATGSGKTFTAISSIYRLVKEGGAKRVLFLVDRGNLGRQALKEFQAYTTPDDGRKFTELYNVTNLAHNKVDPVNKVVITTIQRLYSILKGEASFDDALDEGSAFTGSDSALPREPPPVAYKPERQEGDAKRTSASHKPEGLISAFRNSYNPRVAVTVDMIATGTDIKPLECVVFMRSVKSRGLFEQMKGRGVRVIPDADFQAVTPDAKHKTHFVVVDCVGVMDGQKADPPLDRERGISFEKLLELVSAGNRDEDVLATLAARLDRMDRRLTPDQHAQIKQASGGKSLRDLIAGILDRLDPDEEYARALQLADLPDSAEPTEAQVQAAQTARREEAAAPIAYAPKLREALLEVRKAQEVTLDEVTLDEVTRCGARADLTRIRDRVVVDMEVRMEDFEDREVGILYALFGEELEGIVDELNRELVA